MSLLKDLDEPKSSKYTFSDFWSDFSWDSLQNKVDQAQKEMDDYYFEKLGDRMRRAITVINEEDAKDTNEDSKK